MKKMTPQFLGILLLSWFAVSVVAYLLGGHFVAEVKGLPDIYADGGTFAATYYCLRILTTLSMIIVIPLTYKGHLLALIGGLPYLAVGFNLNPLNYIMPKALATFHDGIWFYPPSYGRIWGVFSLVVFVMYFSYQRRMSKRGRRSPLRSAAAISPR